MHLSKLSLLGFKNYAEADFQFSKHINCFVGNNGEGKTNLLDAIHYLAFCKSFFNPNDSQNIYHNNPFFVIQGEFQNGDATKVFARDWKIDNLASEFYPIKNENKILLFSYKCICYFLLSKCNCPNHELPR